MGKYCEMEDKLLHYAKLMLEEHFDEVDYEEMGATIDMIKDLEEANYYCWKSKKIEKEIEAMTTEQHEHEAMKK